MFLVMTERLTSILQAEGLEHLLTNFTEQGVTDSILAELSDADMKELGVDKLGERKRLLAAFKGYASIEKVAEVSPVSSNVTVSASPIQKTPTTPVEAAKESPFINTLGMPFVPIPRFETRCCIWPVRVQDYEAYCMATGSTFPACPFPQDGDHPIVGVNWNDSVAFCKWLTDKERGEGKVDKEWSYRLPTDLEWSAAVGLPHEPEATAVERHLKLPGYPWGLRWPPPQNAGNYEHQRIDQLGLKKNIEDAEQKVSFYKKVQDVYTKPWEYDTDLYNSISNETSWDESLDGLKKYKLIVDSSSRQLFDWEKAWAPVDPYEFTSPVGSFSANPIGIFDLGGNVWEWCMDNHSSKPEAGVLRGASYGLVHPESNEYFYRSAYRFWENKNKIVTFKAFDGQDWHEYPTGGFRIVLVRDKTSTISNVSTDQKKVAKGTGTCFPQQNTRSWLNEHKDKFSYTDLFEQDGTLNLEKHSTFIAGVEKCLGKTDPSEFVEALEGFADTLAGKALAEPLWAILLEMAEKRTDYPQKVLWLRQYADALTDSIPDTRIQERIAIYRRASTGSVLARRMLGYNLACELIKAGELDEAKNCIKDHLNITKKDVEGLPWDVCGITTLEEAMDDPDLEPIQDFLNSLPFTDPGEDTQGIHNPVNIPQPSKTISQIKTMAEVGNEFLSSLINRTDEELIQILDQDFTYDVGLNEERTFNISNISAELEGTSILDESDYPFSGFQVLIILAANDKKMTFCKFKNHLEDADAGQSDTDSLRTGTKGFAYYMDHESEGFEGTQAEAEAIQNDQDSCWCWVPHVSAQNLYKLQKTDAYSSVFKIKLSECSYDLIKKHIRLAGDTIWISVPRTIFFSDIDINVSCPDDVSKKEFFENCSPDPALVNFAIPYRALNPYRALAV